MEAIAYRKLYEGEYYNHIAVIPLRHTLCGSYVYEIGMAGSGQFGYDPDPKSEVCSICVERLDEIMFGRSQ